MGHSIHKREKVGTGIPGLDQILHDGVLPGMVYLVHGAPGTGKTTLGFQFLREGLRLGERVMYASLLQTRPELEVILASHSWSLEGIDLIEIPESARSTSVDEQTLFSPSDVELHEVADAIAASIEKNRPQRLVFDSITELAVLVDSPYQLRRQMLKLKHRLSGSGCTTLFTVNDTESNDLASVQTVVHGVIQLGIQRPGFGSPRRWMEVTKMRGMVYLDGRHDFRLRTGGLEVFPRLELPKDGEPIDNVNILSGNPELDTLFGGGLDEGTACLITGTTGSGKTTIANLYVEAAAKRGEHSVIFLFDERKQTFLRRAAGLGMKMPQYIHHGLVDLRELNVGDITPGEFAHEIRRAVSEQNVKVVVIDSLTGYLNVMADKTQLMVQLHEVLSYLSSKGVLTITLVASQGFQPRRGVDLDMSYISDTVVLMRNFEAAGVVRRCISVLKKRHGPHEQTIRELHISDSGVKLGPPLRQFQGLLSGNPLYIGDTDRLMDPDGNSEIVGDA